MPPPLSTWCAEAFTVFANGVVAGLGGGGLAGAGTGLLTATPVGAGLTPDHKLIAAIAAAILSAAGNGLKRLLVWHDAHPLPNPFTAPPPPLLPSPTPIDPFAKLP
ncbi:MAG: hypothetical protein H7343_12245 [Undibacterium sp.]|nr:hypothetical protein [Opitutaceae bacterium]